MARRLILAALEAEVVQCGRTRRLLALMARRELAARQTGSVLGVFWPYAQPVLTIGAGTRNQLVPLLAEVFAFVERAIEDESAARHVRAVAPRFFEPDPQPPADPEH